MVFRLNSESDNNQYNEVSWIGLQKPSLLREKRTSLMLIFRGSLPFPTSHSTTYKSYHIVCRGRLVIVERLPHRTKKTAPQVERDAYMRAFYVRLNAEHVRNT